MNGADEGREIGGDFLGKAAVVSVVVAGAQENLLRLVGEDDAIGKVSGVGDLRAAEATVENLVLRKVGWKGGPEADGG